MSLELLLKAVRKGNLKQIEDELAKDSSLINQCQEKNGTPLMTACTSGKLEAVQFLIENGADVNFLTSEQESALTVTCKRGSVEVTDFLLLKQAEVNPDVSDESQLPLNVAMKHGHSELINVLKGKGAKTSVLHSACEDGKADLVERLLSTNYKTRVNLLSTKGWTPLMHATYGGQAEVVRLLLDHDADVDALGKDGKSALHIASNEGNSQIVELLLKKVKKFSEYESERGSTILMEAIRNKSLSESEVISQVKLFLDHGAEINASKNGITPLLLAISNRTIETVKLLVERKADVISTSESESSPLKRAVECCEKEMATLFLRKGANVNLKNSRGVSPLMVASSADMANFLLENGANLKLEDKENKTALLHSLDMKYYDVSELLLRRGANPYHMSGFGKTSEQIIKGEYKKMVSSYKDILY